MLRNGLIILGLLIFTIIFTIVLTLVAMNLGGNYFTDFEFLGSRGYEATGTLGSITGLLLGLLLSLIIYFKLRNHK